MKITPEQLVANGFLPTTYAGQIGVYYTKALVARDMPYFSEYIVDGFEVFGGDKIVVEVCPDGTVQLCDMDSDYTEEGVPVDSEEGMGLLRDAGFKVEQ